MSRLRLGACMRALVQPSCRQRWNISAVTVLTTIRCHSAGKHRRHPAARAMVLANRCARSTPNADGWSRKVIWTNSCVSQARGPGGPALRSAEPNHNVNHAISRVGVVTGAEPDDSRSRAIVDPLDRSVPLTTPMYNSALPTVAYWHYLLRPGWARNVV